MEGMSWPMWRRRPLYSQKRLRWMRENLDIWSNVRRRKRHAELQRRRSRKDGERE